MSTFFTTFWSQDSDLILMFAVVLVAWRWPSLGGSLITPIECIGKKLAARRICAIMCVVCFVIGFRACLLPWFPIRQPGVPDEFSYLLEADTFLHGRLTNPPHPMTTYLNTLQVLQRPTVQSMYPPAQGGALAIGKLLGQPWIGVLLSLAIMFGALLWMLQGWLPAQWALVGALLPLLRFGIVSYWMNTYWGGAVAALGGCLVIGALPRIMRKRRIRDSLLFGLGIGLLANSRPYEGALACIPAVSALAVWLFRERRRSWLALSKIVAPAAIVVALSGAFVLYYNWRVTGDPLLLPHALGDQLNMASPNFVWPKPKPPIHFEVREFDVAYNHYPRNYYTRSWADFWRLTRQKSEQFLDFFLGPPMLIPIAALPWVLLDRRTRLLIIQFGLSAVGAILVVWYTPHYTAPVLAALAGIVIQMMRHLRRWEHNGRPVGIGLTRAVVILLLINFVTSIATVAKNPLGNLPLSWGWSGLEDRGFDQKQLEAMPGRHLIIVRYSQTIHNAGREWVYNDADVDQSKVVWAREIPNVDMQPLLNYYRDRTVWIVEADKAPRKLVPYRPPVAGAYADAKSAPAATSASQP